MTEQPIVSDLAGVLLLIEDNYDKILSSIINEYGVEKIRRNGFTGIYGFIPTGLPHCALPECAASPAKK